LKKKTQKEKNPNQAERNKAKAKERAPTRGDNSTKMLTNAKQSQRMKNKIDAADARVDVCT